jgi:hypothetical protein
MPLVKCPECSADVSDKAAACAKCGYPMAAHPAADTTPVGSREQPAQTGVRRALRASDEPLKNWPCDFCHEPAATVLPKGGRDVRNLLWAALGVVAFFVIGIYINAVEVAGGEASDLLGMAVWFVILWTLVTAYMGLRKQHLAVCTSCGRRKFYADIEARFDH